MRTIRRRLTAMEFDALLPLLRISADRRVAARAALVDGKSFASIAKAYGWTPQAVNGAVTAVWRTLERYQESLRMKENAEMVLPPGWERVTLVLPSSMVAWIRVEVAKMGLEEYWVS